MRHEKASSGKTSSLVKRSLICLYYPNVRLVLKSTLSTQTILQEFGDKLSQRQAKNPIVEIEEPRDHGWNEDCSVDWVTEPYPENVAELLIDRENTSDNEISDP